jgi:hypothetical protein
LTPYSKESSTSADPDRMYESERAHTGQPPRALPGLNAHRAALQRRAAYAYGKGLLRAARRVLLGVLRERPEHRALALLCVSLLLFGYRRALGVLERAQAQLD